MLAGEEAARTVADRAPYATDRLELIWSLLREQLLIPVSAPPPHQVPRHCRPPLHAHHHQVQLTASCRS